MILAIDVGNNITSIAFFDNNSLEPKKVWNFRTKKDARSDDLFLDIDAIIKPSGITVSVIDKIVIACVVPSLINSWKFCSKKILEHSNKNIDFIICNANNAANLSKEIYDCAYAIPNEVAGDIICSNIAAKHFFGSSCIVVDFGTATNINIIDSKGRFLGSIISAGIETSMHALALKASALSEIEIKAPHKLIGGSTQELVQSGIVYGEALKADGFVNKIQEELGYKMQVITTGGWAKIISCEMKTQNTYSPNLLLQGLKLFADNFENIQQVT